MDASLYTHLIYAFFNLDAALNVSPPEEAKDIKDDMAKLRKKNPNVKICYALGGWTFNENANTKNIFSDMVGDAAKRQTFIKNAIAVLDSLKMDGIDMVS
jgi:GH18 family chitinase